MERFLGIDGCPAGWIGAAVTYQDRVPMLCDWMLFPDFQSVVAAHADFPQVAIDMPIGLLETRRAGGRVCDQLARQAIKPRYSSVFSAPPRPALYVETYNEARPYGLSKQAFNICKKIREIDDLLTPELQQRIFEAHPEFAFTCLAGSAMTHPKRTPHGREERLTALRRVFPSLDDWLDAMPLMRKQVAPDDVVDALVLTQVAARKHWGEAQCLPPEPDRDAKGLEMAIWG
jgi:predicted RNase H-like nuclease